MVKKETQLLETHMNTDQEQLDITLQNHLDTFLTSTAFSQFDLPEPLLKGLYDMGFTHCTPIQEQTLKLSLKKKDMACQAQTGTGKTAAFLITVFYDLIKNPPENLQNTSALIITPTRELAAQVYNDAVAIGKYTDFRITQVFGGIDYKKQADILRKGADIVICTPGRIIDYIKQRIFKTSHIRSLVIDEADRLFDLGFTKDMHYILKKLPSYEKRQSMLFSATLSYRVMELTYEFMNLPEVIEIAPDEKTVRGIEQYICHVSNEEKLPLLLGFLKHKEWTRIIIFLNTKAGVEWLTQKLRGNGFPAEGITGDLPQIKRLKLMERFKKNEIKILIATDVASRGIHVEDVSHVFNYDLPQDNENYVHRIGRTARAGATGTSISFACENYVYHLEALENMLGYKIPVIWSEDFLLAEDKARNIPSIQRKTAKPAPTKKTNEKKAPASPPPPSPKVKQAYKTDPSIIMSTEKGGIFGLVPHSASSQQKSAPKIKGAATQQPSSQQKKKRSRRRKNKPAPNAVQTEMNTGAQ